MVHQDADKTSFKEFGLMFGDGFNLEQSHLVELFGFPNVCVFWDYSPVRQIIAMYFPLFEYSFATYIFLEYVNIMLAHRRGDLPDWYWSMTKVVTPFTIFFCVWFRMIFVYVAYDDPQGHTAAFLGFQITLVSVAITNTYMSN
jgi:hypothetical protein